MRRVDGRIVETFFLPADDAAEAQRRAAAAGIDLQTFLGDLIAEVLPEALAEAARAALDRGRAWERGPTTTDCQDMTQARSVAPHGAAP